MTTKTYKAPKARMANAHVKPIHPKKTRTSGYNPGAEEVKRLSAPSKPPLTTFNKKGKK